MHKIFEGWKKKGRFRLIVSKHIFSRSNPGKSLKWFIALISNSINYYYIIIILGFNEKKIIKPYKNFFSFHEYTYADYSYFGLDHETTFVLAAFVFCLFLALYSSFSLSLIGNWTNPINSLTFHQGKKKKKKDVNLLQNWEMGGSSNAASFLKVLVYNFDVLAGFVSFCFSPLFFSDSARVLQLKIYTVIL